METYVIRITTIDNLYADYIVEANSLYSARTKAKEAFFRDYPDADNRLGFSLINADSNKIKEIMMLIKEA